MTNDAQATIQLIRKIAIKALAKVPNTKWEKGSSNEPEKVTMVTLIIKDISDRDLWRLAQAALGQVSLDVQLTPQMEQKELSLE